MAIKSVFDFTATPLPTNPLGKTREAPRKKHQAAEPREGLTQRGAHLGTSLAHPRGKAGNGEAAVKSAATAFNIVENHD